MGVLGAFAGRNEKKEESCFKIPLVWDGFPFYAKFFVLFSR